MLKQKSPVALVNSFVLVLGLLVCGSAWSQNDLIWNTDFTHPATPATAPADLPAVTMVTHEGFQFRFTTEFLGSSIPDPHPSIAYAQTTPTQQLLSFEATQGNLNQCLRTTFELVNPDPDIALEGLSFVIEDVDIGSGSAASPNFWQDVVLLEGLENGSAVASTVTLGGSDVQQLGYGNSTCNRMRNTLGYEIDSGSGNARCFRGAGNSVTTSADINVTFPGAVDQVAVTYCANTVSGDNYVGQLVRIEDFTWNSFLPVSLNRVDSRVSGKNIDVRWETASETFTVGFNIWGRIGGAVPEDGDVASQDEPAAEEWVQLNPALIRTKRLDSVVAQRYRKKVSIKNLDGPLTAIALSSVDLNGHEEGYGPFEPGESYGVENEFEPVPWNDIQSEYSARMESRGYTKVNNRWRKLTPGLQRRLDRADSKVQQIAHVGVEQDGMVRLTYEALLAEGIDLSRIKKSDLAVSYRGQAVPRRTGGPGTRFKAGSFIDFYGQAPVGDDALYIAENRYQLSINPVQALAVKTVRRKPTQWPDTYLQRTQVEQDLVYANTLPSGDPFHMGLLFATANQGRLWPAASDTANPGGYPVEVQDDIDVTKESYIEINLGAMTNPPPQDIDGVAGIDPDHGVEVLVNGVVAELANPTAEGYTGWLVKGTLPAGTLTPGINRLQIRMLPMGYTQTDLLALDSYSVDYHRPVTTLDNKLEIGAFNHGTAANDGFLASGFSNRNIEAYAYAPAANGNSGNLVRLFPRKKKTDGTYQARIPTLAADDTRYWISTTDALPEPSSIEAIGESSALLDRQGDYIVLGHANFLPSAGTGGPSPVGEPEEHALSRYLQVRESQGYLPVVIDVEEVFEQYGFGMRTPAAITAYLNAANNAFAYDHVLLVGGDVNDYLDKQGHGAISFIPTRYAATAQRLQYTPSDALLVDFDGDELADKALGRWPVRSYAELETIVDKTLAYGDRDEGTYDDQTALLIAEEVTAQEGYDFSAQMDRITDSLQSTDPVNPGTLVRWDTTEGAIDRVDVQQLMDDPTVSNPVQAARDAIQAGLNDPEGHALTVFGGHGAPGNWSFNSLFTAAMVKDLDPSGKPTVMMPMACYTTYHNTPETNTLAHQLLLSGSNGAAAIHAAATLSSYSDNEDLGARALKGMLTEGMTLGQAVEQARAATPGRDVRINWTLLGDPTLRVM